MPRASTGKGKPFPLLSPPPEPSQDDHISGSTSPDAPDKRLLLPRAFLVSLALIASLLVFQRGFLLKRAVLPNRSHCQDVVDSQGGCWLPATYNRTIWLVVDALRHDFVDSNATRKAAGAQFFRGKMRKVGELLAREPQNARLYKFRADAPTTTLQRLKAMTTGTLPTFIEAGENFGGSEVTEDNLIDQIVVSKSSEGSIAFLGDDTWLSLYPDHFARSAPSPSFDIKDLDTVDAVVEAGIFAEVARPDWALIVGHCLGVDHAGHRFGPSHPEMSRKLVQMDTLIARLVDVLPEDAVLIVTGDHGMTSDGDHGGDSTDETGAALFVYSKRGLAGGARASEANIEVDQIDLVPTLALLQDVPIPFSNLGMVITSLIPEHLVEKAVKINCQQIIRFAQTYIQQDGSLSTTTTSAIDWLFRAFEAGDASYDLMSQVVDILRSAWTTFNLPVARIGLLGVIEGLLFTALIHDFNLTPAVWLYRSGVCLLQVSLLMTGHGDGAIIALLTVSHGLSVVYHIGGIGVKAFSWSTSPAGLWGIYPLGVVVLLGLSFLSNSFIIYEPAVVRFFLLTFTACSAYQFCRLFRNNSRNVHVVVHFIGAALAIRLGALFERCREEQVGCVQTVFVVPLSSLPLDGIKISRFASGLATLAKLVFIWQSNEEGEKENTSTAKGILSAIHRPMALIVAIHWTCSFLSHDFDTLSLRTAQVVYGMAAASVAGAGVIWPVEVVAPYAFRTFVIVLAMILGDGLTPNLFLLQYAHGVLARYVRRDPYWEACYATLLIAHGYFSLGHSATLAQIPWNAAFVGVPGNFAIQAIPGTLVCLHLYCGTFLVVFRTFVIGDFWNAAHKRDTILSTLLFAGIRAAGVCLAAYIHRRHLMLFKVFAPKFIFEGIGFIILAVILVITSTFASKKGLLDTAD